MPTAFVSKIARAIAIAEVNAYLARMAAQSPDSDLELLLGGDELDSREDESR